MKRRGNKVIFSMFIVMLSLFCLLIVNIFYASIMEVHLRSKEDISKYANKSESKSIIKAKRGSIYDNKQNVIAEDITSYNLIAYLDESRVGANNKPYYIVDVDEAANLLADVLGGEVSYYANLMTREAGSKKYQTEFGSRGKGLDLNTKKTIEEAQVAGLEFITTSKRHYPLGQFSSQLIGFSDLDQEKKQQVGKMGIERLYNDYLNGQDGSSISTVTLDGYKLPNAPNSVIEAVDGSDIYLTLNKNVQQQLEESLSQSLELSKTDKAWGMVMEIETGKIIAIGQAPSFDPEKRDQIEYLFYPLDFVFEPGSTMKAITYAAAIEEGIDLSKTFDSKRIHIAYDKNGRPVRVSPNDKYSDIVSNANNRDWGIIDFAMGFAVSSNVGIVELLSRELTSDTLEKYFAKFKLFEKTRLDGFVGASGFKQYQYPIEKVTSAFGQGSTVTMLQMAQAFGAIVNDGVMMQPYIIEQIIDDNNDIVFANTPTEIGRPISSETSKKMRELMFRVVHDEIATGGNYLLDEIDIIAKTGTAQMVVDGKYSNERYISSIGSAFPADDPKYLVFYAYESILDNTNYLEVARPINDLVLKIADEYNLIDVENLDQKPEAQDAIIVSEMPNVINHSLDYAKSKLKTSKANVIVIGDGDNVINQYPKADQKIISKQKVMLYTGDSKIVMPDMAGWSRKEVVAFWNISNANFIIEGFGNVYKQSIPKGVIIDYNSEVKVYLR